MTSEEKRQHKRELNEKQKHEAVVRQKKYFHKRLAEGGIRGFFGCNDCKTCTDLKCRHNHNHVVMSIEITV